MRVRRWMLAGLVLVSGVAGAAAPKKAAKAKAEKKVVIGYILANRGQLDPATVAAEKMTRINYAFFRVQDGVIPDATPAVAANLAVLTGLKRRNPDLQVLVSVGGGGAGSAGFSEMASTPEGRTKFVDSAIAAGGEVQAGRHRL